MLSQGQPIATVIGPQRSILAAERVMLNFMTHLSGIATLTARFVAAIAGTRARILDTRKTIPGLRTLAKYAVRCGGGLSHRMGLHDAVLIKDNHLAGIPIAALKARLDEAITAARRLMPPPLFVAVEVDTLDQLQIVLRCAVDFVLLDNMPAEMMRHAAAIRDRVAPDVLLEASGQVNLQTVRAIAESGVDRISIGALTHSAPALDIGLDMQETS
jgi:nicotinate-nucleotide pyrophosphorylase (carboxylating)